MALDMEEMRRLQVALQEHYAGWWEPIDHEHGKNKMLWMLAELGEAIQIVKRNPSVELMQQGSSRHDLVEELADVMMYFHDILLCYGITPEEFEQIYREKHNRNMTRWKKSENVAGMQKNAAESNTQITTGESR